MDGYPEYAVFRTGSPTAELHSYLDTAEKMTVTTNGKQPRRGETGQNLLIPLVKRAKVK
jgi:hypothetical protein